MLQHSSKPGKLVDEVWWEVRIVYDSCLILGMVVIPNAKWFWEVIAMSSFSWSDVCKPPHVYIEQNGRALFPNFWTMVPLWNNPYKQKNWTRPQTQQSLKKNNLILWCSFLGVFSKKPFYWLLQYLGNTQDIPSKWPLKGGKCWLTNAFRGAIFSDKPKSLRVLTHHSADFQDLAWPISKG